VERYPKEKLGYEFLGSCYWIEQDFEKAKEAYEKILELDPTDANAYNNLAFMNARMKDRPDAISAVKKYIAVHPDIWNAYHSAWEVHAMFGLYDEAQSFLDEGLQRNPEWSGRVTLWSGMTYLLKNDANRGREKFRIYSDSNPEDIINFAFCMGYSYLLEGKYQMAVSEVRRCVESAQRSKNIRIEMVNRINLGRILAAQREFGDAIDEFDEAERLSKKFYDEEFNPYSLLANYLTGIALVSKGDYQTAQDRADVIQSKVQRGNYNPLHSVFFHLLQAEIFAAQNEPEAAQEEINKLPGWTIATRPRYRKLVAVIDGMKGNFEKAAKEYQNSFGNSWVVLSPWWLIDQFDFFKEHSKLDYNLAKIYEQMGETTKATVHYQKFLDLWKDADPGIPEFEDAHSRLSALK
jgi:tetratricopeptide (TPR) repeat protein